MVIKRKIEKEREEIILRGGQVAIEKNIRKNSKSVCIVLRVPRQLLEKIDNERFEEGFNRTDWILDAIRDKLRKMKDVG